jgi:hypothetical protein
VARENDTVNITLKYCSENKLWLENYVHNEWKHFGDADWI